MPGRTRSRVTLEGQQKRSRIVEMRRDRHGFREIGAELGISGKRAHELYQEALAAIPAAQVDEHRAEEVDLIDTAVRELLSICRNPDVSPRTAIEGWATIRGWSEYRAKLLGLNAPDRHEVVTLDAIDEQIRILTAELGASAPRQA